MSPISIQQIKHHLLQRDTREHPNQWSRSLIQQVNTFRLQIQVCLTPLTTPTALIYRGLFLEELEHHHRQKSLPQTLTCTNQTLPDIHHHTTITADPVKHFLLLRDTIFTFFISIYQHWFLSNLTLFCCPAALPCLCIILYLSYTVSICNLGNVAGVLVCILYFIIIFITSLFRSNHSRHSIQIYPFLYFTYTFSYCLFYSILLYFLLFYITVNWFYFNKGQLYKEDTVAQWLRCWNY